MDEPRNVVLTDYGAAGWGVTSGSNPELVGGAETLDELLEEYSASTVFVQRYLRVHDDLVAIRVRYDDGKDEREDRDTLAARVAATVDRNLDLMAKDTYGDRLVVIALTGDVFGDITDALDPGQPATVVFRAGDGSVRAVTSVVRSDAHDHDTVGRFAGRERSEARVERLVTA